MKTRNRETGNEVIPSLVPYVPYVLHVPAIAPKRISAKLLCRISLLLCVMLSSALSAADKNKKKESEEEAEARQAAEEDAAADKRGVSGDEFSGRGKLALDLTQKGGENTPPPPVLGVFFMKNGQSYQVKVAREDLRPQLALLNGKECILAGKLRNNGKYFIINRILRDSPPPAALTNPKGI